ncbi:hypothetical protein DFH07DRAFT_119993 [Mycena maculata]|uniref:Uncharacterized protein n=1 Tax=Mycena maculata TaxID=230809 RepID=A0AAD7I4A8_9AGAR|nr:hypothetical protein DFH07DRAFT_119993 [Mycena maculata]
MATLPTTPTFTIPISIKGRAQRTFKLVGFGLKTVFTTKISGKLVVRQKTAPIDCDPFGIQPWPVTPPKPDPNEPDVRFKETDGIYVPLPTDFIEDIHEALVSNGIKVRDFAYPVGRARHTNPTHPQSMALDKTSEEDKSGQEKQTDNAIPSSPENAPMPSLSPTWTEPHPCLRPLMKRKWDGVLEIPTPEKPYIPVYETHRIPGWWDQAAAIAEHDYRLSENPRTVPIMGITTRRLLTLSPNLVDLSRYDPMDFEELRRYDRRIVCMLMNGFEPRPWRAIHHPNWVPSAANRARMREAPVTVRTWQTWDAKLQRTLLNNMVKQKMEDDEWEEAQLRKLAMENKENHSNGLTPENPQFFDRIDRDWVTLRQRIDVWERRMDSAQSAHDYTNRAMLVKDLREYDLAQQRPDADADAVGDVDVDMADAPSESAPPHLFIPGQDNHHELPPFPVWGPNAPYYEGDNYRALTSAPTGKTINEYAAELSDLSRYSATADPWHPAPDGKVRDYLASNSYFDHPFFYNKMDGERLSIACLTDSGSEQSESEDEEDEDEDEAPPPPLPRKRRIDEVESGRGEEGAAAVNEGDGTPDRKRVKR